MIKTHVEDYIERTKQENYENSKKRKIENFNEKDPKKKDDELSAAEEEMNTPDIAKLTSKNDDEKCWNVNTSDNVHASQQVSKSESSNLDVIFKSPNKSSINNLKSSNKKREKSTVPEFYCQKYSNTSDHFIAKELYSEEKFKVSEIFVAKEGYSEEKQAVVRHLMLNYELHLRQLKWNTEIKQNK